MSITDNGQVVGNQDVSTDDNDFNTIAFVFQMMLANVQTSTLVKVISCTNDGGVSAVGRVTVQPLVNQMSGGRIATAHGPISNAVYTRMSSAGGKQAVIMDPTPGQIGLMSFCSRDISAVVAAMAAANPGSFRWFDWADGVLVMTLPLGAVPTEYIQFVQDGDGNPNGINIVSPTKITLTAPTVEIDASTEFKVVSPDSEFSGNITADGTIYGKTDVTFGPSATSGNTHEHPTAAPGSPSPPTPGS
jgi:hypothetical protein